MPPVPPAVPVVTGPPKRGRCGVCSCVLLLCASAAALVPILLCATSWNHAIERTLKARGQLAAVHDLMQGATAVTTIPRQADLIVFQHIPRTSGDSMRTHLFSDLALEATPFGCEDPDMPLMPLRRQLSERPDSAARIVAAGREGSVIKGFFSSDDLDTLANATGRPLRRFTFLRHPVERVLSLHAFFSRSYEYVAAMPWRVFARGDVPDLLPYVHYMTPEKLHACVRSHYSNGMTWQLGGPGYGSPYRDASITDAEVLARAKRALDAIDFIGFYELLPTSFWGLWTTVFAHSTVPAFYPVMYLVGTWLGAARLAVSRFASEYPPDIVADVTAANQLDLQLYEYAQQITGRSITMYTSYRAFWAANAGYLVAALLLLAACVYGCAAGTAACVRTLCAAGFAKSSPPLPFPSNSVRRRPRVLWLAC